MAQLFLSDIEEIHCTLCQRVCVQILVFQQIIQRIYREEGGNRHEAVDFAEISVHQKLMVYHIEILFRRVVLRHDLLELSVLLAEGVHLINDLRVFRVMLVGINETAHSVELRDLAVHLAEEKSQKTNKNDE